MTRVFKLHSVHGLIEERSNTEWLVLRQTELEVNQFFSNMSLRFPVTEELQLELSNCDAALLNKS